MIDHLEKGEDGYAMLSLECTIHFYSDIHRHFQDMQYNKCDCPPSPIKGDGSVICHFGSYV